MLDWLADIIAVAVCAVAAYYAFKHRKR